MHADSIQVKLAELRADREAIPWTDRIRLVSGLFGDSSRVRSLGSPASDLLRLLATDPKWEVRKEIADHLSKLGESDFAMLAAILTSDENAFVQAAAERALAGRRKGHLGSLRRAKALDRMENELRKVAERHGPKVSSVVRDIAHRLYQGLVGASVHEMRSVVTAMKVNIEQLARAGDAGKIAAVTRIVPRLTKSVWFLERLLANMREYTLAPSRERATERFDDLFHDALEMVRAEFSSMGRDISLITVESEIPADLTASVSRVQIVLALHNLLKNAHESFMLDEVSFGTGVIKVTASGDGESVSITIEDNGMGLSLDELETLRLFIPGRSSKGNLGTGFGLPIARRNIRAHGGDLFIESQVDVGTSVRIWLPTSAKTVE